jgi:hypothetical protein
LVFIYFYNALGTLMGGAFILQIFSLYLVSGLSELAIIIGLTP